VRLRYGYLIECQDFVKNDEGEVVEVHCTYDPATRGGNAPDGRKVRGTIHWVSVPHAIDGTVRLYDHLFAKPDPDDVEEGQSWRDNLNPKSLEVLEGCKLEPGLAAAQPGERYQFERKAYFCVDTADSTPGAPIFNRTVTLRDTWAKIQKRTP
jgi:glutaminyl-tRNA synthetase